MKQDISDNKLTIGDGAPQFELPGIDDETYTLDSFDAPIMVVVFTCNHCPYAQAYQPRLYKLQEEFEGDVQLVGINSNDAEGYPEDSFDKMKEKSDEFNFPYLRDDDQSVAEEFGAQLTPEAFVFDEDRLLRYHGRVDDNWQSEEDVESEDLRDALVALLNGEDPEPAETPAIGCSIKWLG